MPGDVQPVREATEAARSDQDRNQRTEREVITYRLLSFVNSIIRDTGIVRFGGYRRADAGYISIDPIEGYGLQQV